MRLTVTVTSGPDRGTHLVLNAGDVRRVGRGKDADLEIADSLVSRAHFSIECADTGARIRDLGSSNGTLLNGRKVLDDVVGDGDEVVVGNTKLLVRIEREPRQEIDRPPLSQRPPVEPPPSKDLDRPALPRSSEADRRGGSVGTPAPMRETSAPAAAPPPSSARRPYAIALADADPGVRSEALLAAAWAGEKWLLEHCAQAARRPSVESWEAILLLAILGPPSHLEAILALAKFSKLGPLRFRALGAFGHPGIVPALLKSIADPDPKTASAAGAAFTKITGTDISSDTVVAAASPMSGAPGEAERETDVVAEEPVRLPSLERAQQHWNEVRVAFAKGTRWCRGFDVSREISDGTLVKLDLESRWEACLRGRFDGTWKGSLVDLEVFPQAHAAGRRRRI
jgi:hypothetical protein